MIDLVELPLIATGDEQTPSPADKKRIYEHRRLNLTMLTAERGTKNRLAQLAGTSGSRISLMTSARKPVSDPFAVAIEDGLGLPRGWLDQARSVDVVPASVWQTLRPEAGSEQAAHAAKPTRPARSPSSKRAPREAAAKKAINSTPCSSTAPDTSLHTQAAVADDLSSTTGLFNKPAGQCGPIAEALAKTIINLSTTDKLSEALAFQLLGQVISASNPAD